MIIELVIKIVSAGIVASVLSLILNDLRKEYAIILRLISVIIIIFNVLSLLKDKFNDMYILITDMSVSTDLISIMLKGVLIIIITSISSDLCIESGSASIGRALRFTGRVIIVIQTYPLLESVLEAAVSFVGG